MNGEAVVDTKGGLGVYCKQGQVLPVASASVAVRLIENEKRFLLGAHESQDHDPGGQQQHMLLALLADTRVTRRAFASLSEALRKMTGPSGDMVSSTSEGLLLEFKATPRGPEVKAQLEAAGLTPHRVNNNANNA